MTDGMISPGDPAADVLGFTIDRWAADSYLWRTGDEIMCSLMVALEPGKGAFRDLVKAVEAAWMRVAVPTPMGRMQAILEHYGFVKGVEIMDDGEPCDVWRRPAP